MEYYCTAAYKAHRQQQLPPPTVGLIPRSNAALCQTTDGNTRSLASQPSNAGSGSALA